LLLLFTFVLNHKNFSVRYLSCLLLSFLLSYSINAQIINVSGQCISGTITLDSIGQFNGKTVYQGSGTVDGFPGVTVSMYWLDIADNVWVLDFDGQPYFQNACNTTGPRASGSVACPWTVVSATSCTGVPDLFIGGDGALPVQLTSFTARKQNTEVLLTWKTASEDNNKGFGVEKSRDGINWNSIGFVNGAVTSALENQYSFTDKKPFAGQNYYRLAQYDLDGNQTYSAVVNASFINAGFYMLGNNPGNGNYVLTIKASSEPVDISLIDLNGSIIIHKKAGDGVHLLDISKYPTGTYLLRLTRGNETVTEKLIKL
jgi:hypothetical protein